MTEEQQQEELKMQIFDILLFLSKQSLLLLLLPESLVQHFYRLFPRFWRGQIQTCMPKYLESRFLQKVFEKFSCSLLFRFFRTGR